MEYSKPFLIFRRRLAKTLLRIFGWKFRGQDPQTSKRHIIFINDSKGALAKNQHLWMRHLTAADSYFIELGDRTGFEEKINQQATILVKWRDDIDKNELEWLSELATLWGIEEDLSDFLFMKTSNEWEWKNGYIHKL